MPIVGIFVGANRPVDNVEVQSAQAPIPALAYANNWHQLARVRPIA